MINQSEAKGVLKATQAKKPSSAVSFKKTIQKQSYQAGWYDPAKNISPSK